MAYYIDAEKVGLDDLRKRIEATDLVPTRTSLKENIGQKMKALEKQGITTLASLRNELRTAKRQAAVAKATGIDVQYLVLLRREIEGYFPRPFALKTFVWLSKGEIVKLAQHEIDDTAALYEAANSVKKRTELAKSTGLDIVMLNELVRLADLTRVQWVSPTTARMLIATGCDSVAKLAVADAAVLCEALERVNAGNKFSKAKIGQRDVKRLVQAARYL